MLAILTSATLAKDVRPTDESVGIDAATMVWYGHRVTIERRKCLVLMEASTRYGILFTALTKPDFQRLGERLIARLPDELARLHGGDPAVAERFRQAVRRLADPLVITPGRDRSVQAHINDFVHEVRMWVDRNGRLPRNEAEAFRAALRPNWLLKMGKHYPKGLTSATAFIRRWLDEADIQADTLPAPVRGLESLWLGELPRRDAGTFQIRIELLDANPAIWRTLRVPANLPLGGLHQIIQIAMGWGDYHLYEFDDGSRRYGKPNLEWADDGLDDEDEFTLDQLVTRPGDRLNYLYDLGDDWRHRLTLEGIEPPGAQSERLKCLDGARRCPPEDVGGLPGYFEFIGAVRNPAHPEHADMLRWAGGEFDPDDFDVTQTNAELTERIRNSP